MINQDIKIGKPFKIGERVFHPLVKILQWKNHQIESYYLSPVAIVVVEGDMKYLLPLDEVENPEELMDMVSV